ncbi:MAG: hypothetical protein GXX79_17795 [Actinomycetales bacterium]|nr:hypothetical protein [Actinomycetales bacterium]
MRTDVTARRDASRGGQRGSRRLPAPSVRGIRGATAMSVAITRHRGWRDRWLLLSLLVLVAGGAFLAVAVPRATGDVLDEGVRDAVRQAGDAVDLQVEFPVGGGVSLAEIPDVTTRLVTALPPTLAAVTGQPTTAATSDPLTVSGIRTSGADRNRARPLRARTQATLRLGVLAEKGSTGRADAGYRYVEGRAPAPRDADAGADGPVRVAVPREVASLLRIGPGDRISTRTVLEQPVELQVSGIVEPVDPEAPGWDLLPTALRPEDVPASADGLGQINGTVLVPSTELPAAQTTLGTMRALARLEVRPERFAAASAPRLRTDVSRLTANPREIADVVGGTVSVRSSLADVLTGHLDRARAASAQASVWLAGIVGVVAVVLLLGARLLVTRRRGLLVLEHARGASSTSIALRLLLESAVVTGLGCLAGTLAALALVGGPGGTADAGTGLTGLTGLDWLPLALVAGTGLLAAPVLGACTATRALAHRARATDRRARGRQRLQRGLRRVVVEVFVLALATSAVLAIRTRGILQTRTDGIDPLLAAAPLLLALAITVVLLRIHPLPVRALAALAVRRRGVVPLLATARAGRAMAIVPLLALALAVGLGIAAGLIRGTVDEAQELAAWEQVGAQVRIEGAVDEDDLRRLREQPGVTHVAAGSMLGQTPVRYGDRYDRFTLIGVDSAEYDAVLAETPLGYRGEQTLLDEAYPGRSAPIAATADIARLAGGKEISVHLGSVQQAVTVAAPLSVPPVAGTTGPVAVVDLGVLDRAMGTSVPRDLVWVSGPGAHEAVARLPGLDHVTTVSRVSWLDSLRTAPLLLGVLDLLWLTVLTVALLGAVALIATVVSGARERGQVLSTLRTLGMTTRQGRWTAFGELVPLVLTAVLAGVTTGVAILYLLGPALGLVELTGGLTEPHLRVEPRFVLTLVAGIGALLVLSVLVELAANRRNRLADVLRLGDLR